MVGPWHLVQNARTPRNFLAQRRAGKTALNIGTPPNWPLVTPALVARSRWRLHACFAFVKSRLVWSRGPVRAPTVLALLLVGRCRGRSLLAADDGGGHVPVPAILRSGPQLPGSRHPKRGDGSQVPHHGPRTAIRSGRIPALVPPPRNPPAPRRHREVREVRQHRHRGAAHPYLEGRVHAKDPRSTHYHGIPARAVLLRRLVQRQEATSDARCEDPRRGLLRATTCVSQSPI